MGGTWLCAWCTPYDNIMLAVHIYYVQLIHFILRTSESVGLDIEKTVGDEQSSRPTLSVIPIFVNLLCRRHVDNETHAKNKF